MAEAVAIGTLVCILVAVVGILEQIRRTLNDIRDLAAEWVKRQGRGPE
jgi:hypothetical protein